MNSHLSEEQISNWIAGERSIDAERHARDCPQCTAELKDTQDALLLFRETAHRFGERQPIRPRSAGTHFGRRLACTAAAIAVAVFIGLSLPHPSAAKQVFLQIPYVVPAAPYERTEIVRMEVPVAALIAAGFKIETSAAEGSIPADVLLGQDGRALAVSLSLSSQINRSYEQ